MIWGFIFKRGTYCRESGGNDRIQRPDDGPLQGENGLEWWSCGLSGGQRGDIWEVEETGKERRS